MLPKRKELVARARQWKKVLRLLEDDATSVADICERHPWVCGGGQSPSPPPPTGGGQSPPPTCNVLTPAVLALLERETGVASAEAWWNVWWLISKPEHDNERRERAFLTDGGDSVFAYAEALGYDWKERGVTMGIVGFTTGCDGKDCGDAFGLFDVYASLGGEDLAPLAKGCTKDKARCQALANKVRGLGSDPKWVEAQWRALVARDGYIRKTAEAWREVGVAKPSALAVATVLCTSLNQGWDGPDGGCTTLKKLAVRGDENATLEKYNKWRRGVAGTNDYNSPKANGENRADQYEKLRRAGAFSLEGPRATQAVRDAVAWVMK